MKDLEELRLGGMEDLLAGDRRIAKDVGECLLLAFLEDSVLETFTG